MMRIGDAKKKSPQGEPPPLPPQAVNHPPPAEMKYTEGAEALVPDSAARWRAKREHLGKLYSTQ